jgi:hypothetical protein
MNVEMKGLLEASVAQAKQHSYAAASRTIRGGGGDGQVKDAVTIEVSGHQRGGTLADVGQSRNWNCKELAVALIQQDGQSIVVDHRHVESLIAVEIAYDQR